MDGKYSTQGFVRQVIEKEASRRVSRSQGSRVLFSKMDGFEDRGPQGRAVSGHRQGRTHPTLLRPVRSLALVLRRSPAIGESIPARNVSE
ncbi:MAG: hypothetical protein M0C28_34835 [Candidatus Moduliflexus flocculans]|nr:hypothetical protein [Candidatus Moduliflexus flocculans]